MLFVRKLCVFEGFWRLRRFDVGGVIFLDWLIGVVWCGVGLCMIIMGLN